MNRISRNRTSRSSHPHIRPEPLEPRQLLSATPVFYTTGAVTLGSPGQVAFTGTQDLAPGTTYSYDLNNDGAFEVENSTSPACDVPAADLASVGPHTISARINDPLGTTNNYYIQIPVNPLPDYFPVVDGLTRMYWGREDGKKATWPEIQSNTILDGRPAILSTEQEYFPTTHESADIKAYFALSDGILTELREDTAWHPSGETQVVTLPTPVPYNQFGHSRGWSQTWTNLGMQVSGTSPTRGPTYAVASLTVKLTALGVVPLRLANGLYFSRASGTKIDIWATVRGVSRHAISTNWYAQGVGMLRETYSGGGSYKMDLVSLPDWAKYLSLSSDGILHVNGSTSDDTITFAVKGKTLTCYRNGVPDSLPLASVRGIIITGQGGNDSFDASKLSLPVTITTGSGNDSILGSKADDSIFSGDGNDTISGGKGNDTLAGGLGSDLLIGGSGTNRFEAQDGMQDILDGRGGRNTALWDPTLDTILGKLTPA